jgi:branched-chain amino acid transport system substrate-binding protein
MPAGILSAGIAHSATPKPARITLHVAVLEPARGDFSAQTRLMANGLEIGVASINRTAKKTGVRIQLDRTRFKPQTKPAALITRLAKAGVTAVVLPCHPDLQATIAAAAARRKLLVLAPCDSNARTAQRVPRYWSVGMAGNAEAAGLANFAALQNGTSALIVSSKRSSYSTTFAGYLREAAKRRGISVVGQTSVRLDGRDVDSLVTEIRRTKPRVILSGLFSPYSEKIVLKLRARGILTPIYLTSGADMPMDLARYGDAMKDVTFASFGFARPNADQPFVAAYRTRFRREVYGGFPGIGFETARVLDTAARKARSNAPDALDRALTRGFTTVGIAAGGLAYGPGIGHHPVAEVSLARIIRGAYVPLVASVPPAAMVPPA